MEMNSDAQTILRRNFVKMRQTHTNDDFPLVSYKHFLQMIKIAESSAESRGCKVIESEDAEIAVREVEGFFSNQDLVGIKS